MYNPTAKDCSYYPLVRAHISWSTVNNIHSLNSTQRHNCESWDQWSYRSIVCILRMLRAHQGWPPSSNSSRLYTLQQPKALAIRVSTVPGKLHLVASRQQRKEMYFLNHGSSRVFDTQVVKPFPSSSSQLIYSSRWAYLLPLAHESMSKSLKPVT